MVIPVTQILTSGVPHLPYMQPTIHTCKVRCLHRAQFVACWTAWYSPHKWTRFARTERSKLNHSYVVRHTLNVLRVCLCSHVRVVFTAATFPPLIDDQFYARSSHYDILRGYRVIWQEGYQRFGRTCCCPHLHNSRFSPNELRVQCSLSAPLNVLLPTVRTSIIIIIVISCHRPFLPGTSLEPAVIPTAQASSFTLQYFPYYVWCSKYSCLL